MRHRLIWPALALAVLLAACSASGRAYTTADAQALIDAGAFDGEMEQVDEYTVALLYGIEEESITDCASYMAINSSVSADEVTVLVLSDEEAAKAAEEACRKRVESQIESYQTYGPRPGAPAGGRGDLPAGEHRAAGGGQSGPAAPGAGGSGAGLTSWIEHKTPGQRNARAFLYAGPAPPDGGAGRGA